MTTRQHPDNMDDPNTLTLTVDKEVDGRKIHCDVVVNLTTGAVTKLGDDAGEADTDIAEITEIVNEVLASLAD